VEAIYKASVIRVINNRIDWLLRKISETQEIQQRSDVDLAYYRELHKLYRRVLEAEELGPGHKISRRVDDEGIPLNSPTIVTDKPTAVADAVRRVMAEHPGEKLHRSEIAELTRARYPEIVNKSKYFEDAVGYALQAGKENGLWKWVRSGTYQYK